MDTPQITLQENPDLQTEFKIAYWRKNPPQSYWQKNPSVSNKLPPITLSRNKNMYYILIGGILPQKI
jgi:hypothetical protein